jgi:hypothetical protein
VAAAALVFTALAGLTALVVPPFSAGDEAQHTSYALDVADGTLPVLYTPVRSRIPGMPGLRADCVVSPAQARAAVRAGRPADLPRCTAGRNGMIANIDLTYTANHPPLFYLVEAAPLGAGEAAGHPLAGFRAARLVNVAIGITALVAVAALARVLVPARPDLAVGAAALTGVTGMFAGAAGQVYNDVLAVATTTAALSAAVVVIRRGPSRARLIALGVAVAAAAASRASGAVAALIALVAAGVGVALHAGEASRLRSEASRYWWRRAGRGLATSLAGAAVVFAGTGWFYLRNRQLYGDLTGSGRVADLFPVRGGPSVHEMLTSGRFWLIIYRGAFGRSNAVNGLPGDVATAVGVAFVIGLALAVARWLAGRLTTPPPAWSPNPTAGTVVAWGLVAAHTIAVVATLVGYVAAGGAPFTRYLLPALPVAALLLAMGLAALPGGRRGLPTLLAVGALVPTFVIMTSRELAFKHPPLRGLDLLDRFRTALAGNGLPAPDAVLGVLAGVFGVGALLLAVALWMLARAAVPRWPRRSGVREPSGALIGEGSGVSDPVGG